MLDRLISQARRRGRFLTAACACVGVLAAPASIRAEDAKTEKEKRLEPPALLIPLPLAASTGSSNIFVLRGLRLKNATAIKWLGLCDPPPVHILKREETKVPDGLTAAKAGDQQLEVEFFLPFNTSEGTNAALVAIGPSGESKPLPILMLSPDRLMEEQEPNDGFKEAQRIRCGQTVRGTLSSAADVDVFKVAGKSGQAIRIEVIAGRLGSTLDSALTLYDAKGAILAYNDDAAGRDAMITYKPAKDADFFVALTSVNEKSSKTHAYLLQVGNPP